MVYGAGESYTKLFLCKYNLLIYLTLKLYLVVGNIAQQTEHLPGVGAQSPVHKTRRGATELPPSSWDVET